MQQKIRELEQLAAAEGLTLPYPPEMIVRLEETGAVVDLRTGEITPGAASHRYGLTVLGEAVAVVAKAGGL